MVSAGVRELEVMSLAVNYHRWTYRVMQPHMGNRVLEVGGGLGSLSTFMQDRERLVIIDVDQVCLRHLRDQFGDRSNICVLEADILDPSLHRQLADERLDTAVCINVLEHIEDDRTALRHMYDAILPGGRLILLVPAHPSLYGTLDELVGHYRRYERKELITKVEDAGFTISTCHYFNSLGAFGRYVVGRLRRQQETGEGQVRFYDRYVVPVLRRVEAVVPPPFGQSLVVVGCKQEPI